jgi:hypothetical protein
LKPENRISRGRIKRSSTRVTAPFSTHANPTEQALARCSLAVSKSMAMTFTSIATSQFPVALYNIPRREEQMLKFKVRRSSDYYDIVVDRRDSEFKMTCTCRAGLYETLCKHRTALLDGDIGAIVSENESDVAQIKDLFQGTDAERSFLIVRNLEKQKATIDEKLKREKRALARMLSE